MTSRKKVAIVTSTRFHLVDLARELLRQGHEVQLVSYLPHAHVERSGVPRRNHTSLLLPLAPVVGLLKLPFGRRLKRTVSERLLLLTDRLAAKCLPPCDVLVGLSGLCIASSDTACRRGARIVIDSGSAHVASALRQLGRAVISSLYERRERAAYAAADCLVVGSSYAASSFEEHLPRATPLFVNPYGVDLTAFAPTPREALRPTLVFVGNWSRRKGCDLLVDAWRKLDGVDLLHVGPVVDLPLPMDSRFSHHQPVPQEQLHRFYRRGDVLVLPSRDDGYGLVLNQAAACGLSIVASDHCGAPDLKALVGQTDRIQVFASGQGEPLLAALKASLTTLGVKDSGPRDWLGPHRRALGWEAYGERYSRYIDAMFSGQ